MEFTHPEARCKPTNPYFAEAFLSQELLVPLPFIPPPPPASTFKIPMLKARPKPAKPRRAPPTQLPRRANQLYPFVEQ